MSEALTKTDQIIAVIPEDLQAEAFTDAAKIDAFIEQMTQVVESHSPDVSTATGRDEIKSLAHGVSKAKVKLDNHGKAITEDWRKKTKVINEARKTITTRLDALRDKAREPVTKWEAEKAEKEAAIQARIDEIKFYLTKDGANSEVCQEYLNELNAIDIDESFGGLRDDAYAIHKEAVEKVTARLADTQKREAEQAELEALRAEKAKRHAEEQERLAKQAAAKAEIERLEREQKEQAAAALKAKQDAEAEAKRIEEAAQAAKLKAEQEAKAALEKAEREAAAKLQAEKDKAAKAEADRLAAIKAEEEAQRKREENKAHRKRVKSAAAKALVTGVGVDSELAQSILALIENGDVPNVSINF